MQHVLNHSTYHRGQVSLLLRARGVRPGFGPIFVAWDRAQPARSHVGGD